LEDNSRGLEEPVGSAARLLATEEREDRPMGSTRVRKNCPGGGPPEILGGELGIRKYNLEERN